MKKLPILVGIAVGGAFGLFSSIHDDAGLKIVMIFLGALTGLAIGGAFERIGESAQVWPFQNDALDGLGVTSEDIARNYWRDQTRPPLTSPLKAEYGEHIFDPDKL